MKKITLFVCLSLLFSLGPALAQDAAVINSIGVVPRIVFPGIPQSDFQHAFNILQNCVVTRLPVKGFTHPFMYPGGLYDKYWYKIDSVRVLGVELPRKPYFEKFWWELDGTLTLSGAKWANQKFAENVMKDFISVQHLDGRIPLFALDKLSFHSVSAFPTILEIGYAIARRTGDVSLVKSIYLCLKKYLNWWLSYSVRRDRATGLVTGLFEESLPSNEGQAFTRAPVDLNTEIVMGCRNVARLAKQLGDIQDYRKYSGLESELKRSMNKYMWADSAYYAYNVRKSRIDKTLLCNAFYPLEDNIASGDRITKLLRLLTNNRYFNWDQNPVTTAAKTDPAFNETGGVYNGSQWMGDIWSMKNVAIIQGLEDVGRYDLAAYLSYKTVMLFNNNCTEFIVPSTGLGQGQLDYGWSASQYIQVIIEKIFGVDYDNFDKTITLMPRLAQPLIGHELSLDSLRLPDGDRLNLDISSTHQGAVDIKYALSGIPVNKMRIVIALPANRGLEYEAADSHDRSLQLSVIHKGLSDIFSINEGIRNTGQVEFTVRNKTANN